MLAITAAARRIAAPSFTVKRAALIAAASRPISSSAIIKADHPSVPIIQGEGVPAGQVPTDEAQSTGLERCAVLACPHACQLSLTPWLTFSDMAFHDADNDNNRMELLAKLRGEDPFHMAPLEVGGCAILWPRSPGLTGWFSSCRCPSTATQPARLFRSANRSHTWEHQRTQ